MCAFPTSAYVYHIYLMPHNPVAVGSISGFASQVGSSSATTVNRYQFQPLGSLFKVPIEVFSMTCSDVLIYSYPTTPLAQPDLPAHPVISDIDRQLAHINRQVVSLQAERNNVTIEAPANGEGRQADGREDERFRGVLLIEEECIRYVDNFPPSLKSRVNVYLHRLRQSERSLRQQLLVAKAAASATEQSLKSLIDELQQQVQKLVNDFHLSIA